MKGAILSVIAPRKREVGEAGVTSGPDEGQSLGSTPSSLMIGISGVRGVVGQSLTPVVACRFAGALAAVLGSGPVVLSRDTRPSGTMLGGAVIAGLTAAGRDVIDLGQAATPTCSLAVVELGAAGGIQISGSHNPSEWNALKFFRSDGIDVSPDQAAQIRRIYEQDSAVWVDSEKLGQVRLVHDHHERHIQRVLEQVDVEQVRQRRLRVVLDACNGAGALIAPQLLERLGCQLIVLNGQPHGRFAHDPEPVGENLNGLRDAVRQHRADLGIALDSDADRLALVDETGQCVGEDYSLVIVTQHVLSQSPGPVVINMSTSRAVEDVAQRHGVDVYRTPVGEVNVADKMKEVGSVIGGEGNGGVINPRICMIRDAMGGAALVIQALVETGKPLTEMAADLPRYHIIKTKTTCSRDKIGEILRLARNAFPQGAADWSDGIRLAWGRRWVHVRPSNTEPLLRIIAEAPSEDTAQDLVDTVLRITQTDG